MTPCTGCPTNGCAGCKAGEEFEVSRIAARDLDGPRKCACCGETRTVMLLMAGDWAMCSTCFRNGVEP